MTNGDARPDPSDVVSLDAPAIDVDRDGVATLHDTEAEAGDEGEAADLFDLDGSEAREMGVDLDRADGGETELD